MSELAFRPPDALLAQEAGGLPDWLDLSGWKAWALGAVVALLFVRWMYRKARRAYFHRHPRIHPKLRKYSGELDQPSEELTAKRRVEAEHIITTSSTAHITGYEIVEQVEAVFVDGFRRPEEAVEGLKAVAAMKGANAVTNVKHERTASGKCNASGDAVIVQKRAAATTGDMEKAGTDDTDRSGFHLEHRQGDQEAG